MHAGRPALAPFLLLKQRVYRLPNPEVLSQPPAIAPHAPHAAGPHDSGSRGSGMHDPAYKLLFSRPRMVRDLLDGFAARGWSGALDFDTLDPLPASFVSEDLQQRHGDLVWRIRFRDDRWLYLVLLLEFQATVDRAMALRMLAYTALLYQRLDADGVLRDHGALPPVLPVVLYNGRRPWTAPVEMTDLVAAGSTCWRRTSRRSDTIFWTGREWPTRTCRRTTWCRCSSVSRRRATRGVCARCCGRWATFCGRRGTTT